MMEQSDEKSERMRALWRRRVGKVGVFLVLAVIVGLGMWLIMRKNEEREVTEAVGSADRESRERRSFFCAVKDEEAPEIHIDGVEVMTMAVGGEYVERGATVRDKCDGEVELSVEGEVDVGNEGDYEVKYEARDRAENLAVAVRKVKVVDPSKRKRIVYLTFDDGPSEHTARLLDVLKEYGVKATFFVTGYGEDEMIRREFEEGHTVALHTNSHRYDWVYASEAAYFEDLQAVRDRVFRITGVEPKLIRFPGGSSNTISAKYSRGIMSRLVEEVEERGYRYVDWNVDSRDAEGVSGEEVLENVMSTLKEGESIVLQHDTKGESVDKVGEIIEYGMREGYVFLPMSVEQEFLAHHGVNN